MYYPSKKDAFFTILIWGLVLTPHIAQMMDATPISVRIVIVSLSIFLVWAWFGTGYKIEEKKLKFIFGPIRWSISIQDIKKVNDR